MNIIHLIQRTLGIWQPISRLPRWIRLPGRDITALYGRTFHFKGKNFIYKYVNITHGQGDFEERYYKMPRR